MNILAIGCHPDDVEIACAGTLAKCVKRGDKVIITETFKVGNTEWGKIGEGGVGITVYGDATITLPVLATATLERLEGRK